MRYFVLLCLIALAYLYFVRSKPGVSSATSDSTTPVTQTVSTPTPSNFVKRPIDTAKKAVEAAEKRNSGF